MLTRVYYNPYSRPPGLVLVSVWTRSERWIVLHVNVLINWLTVCVWCAHGTFYGIIHEIRMAWCLWVCRLMWRGRYTAYKSSKGQVLGHLHVHQTVFSRDTETITSSAPNLTTVTLCTTVLFLVSNTTHPTDVELLHVLWLRLRSHWYEYKSRVRVSVYGSYKLHPHEWAFRVTFTRTTQRVSTNNLQLNRIERMLCE